MASAKLKNELEEFLYVVSHDFNAPLRHIREFTNILFEKLDDGRISEKEKLYADYVKSSVKEAEEMLSALLRYSRLNTQPEEVKEIDIRQAAEDVIAEFKEKISEKGGAINLYSKGNILLEAGEKRVKIVIKELVDNAIKFSSKSRLLEVNINMKKRGDVIEVSVADNGIGYIPENLSDEIFKIFRKLHPKEEYGGSGMGLTICKKIIEDYRGDIYMLRSDASGTEIVFSIPKKCRVNIKKI